VHVIYEAGDALAEVFHERLLESGHAVEHGEIAKRGLERVLHARDASSLSARADALVATSPSR
jgi:hypothetical protein